MREILFRGKRTDDGEWVEGNLLYDVDLEQAQIFYFEYSYSEGGLERAECAEIVAPETVGQYTGLTDKNGKKIFEGDIVKLILDNGEIRFFKVSIKKVKRRVISHPNFVDASSYVEITGVVFEWNGFQLFPCVDENGIVDYSKMEIVGNIHDNPELLEVE